jgi:hypothetical protein
MEIKLNRQLRITISLILTLTVLINIALVQFREFKSFRLINNGSFNENSSIYKNSTICLLIDVNGFNFLTTPLAFLITLILIILHKRQSLCIQKCSWKYIGLPIVISLWYKKDRMNSSMVYGQISFQIFQYFEQSIASFFGFTSSNQTVDPTGLSNILLIVSKVLVIGIRKSNINKYNLIEI